MAVARRRDPSTQCHGKVRYQRKPEAKRALRRLQSLPRELWEQNPLRDGARLTVYRCPHCLHWHLGHAVDPDQLPHRRTG